MLNVDPVENKPRTAASEHVNRQLSLESTCMAEKKRVAPDREVVERFVEHLRDNGYGDLKIDSWLEDDHPGQQAGGTLQLELRGNLAAMLGATVQSKRSPETDDLSLQVSLVAGVRFGHGQRVSQLPQLESPLLANFNRRRRAIYRLPTSNDMP